VAWTIASAWVNPPSFDGTNSRVHRAKVIISGTSSDTTEMADESLLDISTLTNVNGATCTKIAIESINWSMSGGLDAVRLEFDATTDQSLGTFADTNSAKYDPPIIKSAAGGTGDILATSFGAAAGAAFRFELCFRVI